MPEQTHRHAAIMFTDIVGYTALMGSDEDKAFEILEKNTEIHNKLIAEHKGALIKAMGDGMLVSFNLASDAVRCAVEIQKECKEQDIPLKIGIHEGEMVFADADVLGDAVNIASRLQDDAVVGSISISSSVYKNVRNKAGITTSFIEERTFKNVEEPVKVYQVLGEGEEQIPFANKPKNRNKKYPLWAGAAMVIVILAFYLYPKIFSESNKDNTEIATETGSEILDKSLAILPFEDLSPNQDQEWFAVGLTDELLNRLKRIPELKLISRNSSSAFKGKGLTTKQIADTLNVNYILEGSVRKSQNNIRVTALLIKAVEDAQIWSENYNYVSDSIFAIQDYISLSITKAMNILLDESKRAKMFKSATRNADAYELYLQATWNSNADVERSIILLEKAIEQDPEFADAYVLLGFLKSQFWWFGESEMASSEEAFNTGWPYYEKALELDPDNIVALRYQMSGLVLYRWDFEDAVEKMQILKQLDPYSENVGFLLAFGRFNESLEIIESISENDPFSVYLGEVLLCYYFNNMEDETLQTIENAPKGNPHLDMDITRVYLFLEKYDEALVLLNLFFENYEDAFINASRPLGFLAIANYHTGKLEETHEILEKLKKRSEGSSAGSPAYYITMIYAQMGEIDLAFQWLEKAYIDREVEMYWLKVVPLFEPMHNDPRWQQMLDRVGFPE